MIWLDETYVPMSDSNIPVEYEYEYELNMCLSNDR